jgi:hypothetical protein
MVFSNNLLLGAAGAGGGYTIDQSIRFDNVDGINAGGAQMYRLALTGTPTNDKKATISAWVKRATLGYNQTIAYSGDPNGSTIEGLRFNTNDTIFFSQASSVYALTTTQVFRDVGAWYHIVAEIDTANGTAADRANLYVNGEKITSFSTATYPSLNYVTNWTASSASIAHAWGTNGIPAAGPSSQLFAGYMAEMYVLDGEKAGPTAFGEFNDSGVWIPKAYSGAFGNNGYYMTGGNASALGEDVSGNNLDFTTVALATTDQMLDTPTDNFWTLTPLDSSGTLANGNLQNKGGGSTNTHAPAFPTTGKWYVEIDCNDINTGTAGAHFFGICDASVNFNQSFTDHTAISAGQQRGGQLKKNNSNTTTGTAVNDGDIIALAFDADNLTLDLYVNNSQSGSQITGLTDVQYKLWIQDGASVTDMQVNFGQTGGFTYTPPTGFNALSTANLDDPTIADPTAYFQTLAYASTGTITAFVQDGNSQFEPGLVWEKSRTGANNHLWFDQVRGATKFIRSDTTNTENTVADTLTSFNSNGFTAGADSVNWGINYPGRNNVAWMWKANGAGSSNTDGSITSTVSADTTSGFSIIRWSGTGANGTIGHGLGIQPSLYIVKNTATTNSWMVGSTLYDNTKFLILNASDALDTAAAVWNSAYPTSSVVNLGSNVASNGSGTNNMICYAFAEVEGFSSIGSYTGNGSTNGPFVYTGFKPAFVMFKVSTNAPTGWVMLDNQRDTYNAVNHVLQPNESSVENSGADNWDFLSNGFKVRTTWPAVNGNGYTVTYMAFAEHPFGGDGVAPATAR